MQIKKDTNLGGEFHYRIEIIVNKDATRLTSVCNVIINASNQKQLFIEISKSIFDTKRFRERFDLLTTFPSNVMKLDIE